MTLLWKWKMLAQKLYWFQLLRLELLNKRTCTCAWTMVMYHIFLTYDYMKATTIYKSNHWGNIDSNCTYVTMRFTFFQINIINSPYLPARDMYGCSIYNLHWTFKSHLRIQIYHVVIDHTKHWNGNGYIGSSILTTPGVVSMARFASISVSV